LSLPGACGSFAICTICYFAAEIPSYSKFQWQA
jgi:hypothetical protein